MFLAEVTNFSPPEQIAAWLACLGFVLWIGLLIDKAIQRVRGKAPEPANSQLESDQKEIRRRVKVLEDWKDSLLQKLDADKKEILLAGEDREVSLAKKINTASERIDALQKTMAEIPGEFMALLANAKNILKL